MSNESSLSAIPLTFSPAGSTKQWTLLKTICLPPLPESLPADEMKQALLQRDQNEALKLLKSGDTYGSYNVQGNADKKQIRKGKCPHCATRAMVYTTS